MSRKKPLQPSDHPVVWYPCDGPYQPNHGDKEEANNKEKGSQMTTLQQLKISCVPPKSVKKNSKQIIQVKGRPIIVSGKHWKKAEKVLRSLLAPHAPASPHEGPLCVDVDWVYPYRSSTRKRDLGMMIPCDTRPDKDNLASGLFDVMETLGFWPDDARIAQGNFLKWNGPNPGIKITIRRAVGFRVMSKEEYTLMEKGVGV